jgi:hypothetical protein
VERLKAYGAYMVVADDYIRTREFRQLISDLPKPKLALNAVGGDTATEMSRLLGYVWEGGGRKKEGGRRRTKKGTRRKKGGKEIEDEGEQSWSKGSACLELTRDLGKEE